MKLKNTIFLGLILAQFQFETVAEEESYLSYSYTEAVYIHKSSDDVDYNAFEINFSYPINSRVFVLGSLSELILEIDTSGSFGTIKNDRTRVSTGAGIRFAFSSNTDFVSSATLDFYNVGTSSSTGLGGGSLSGNGHTIKTGLRHLLQPNIELTGDFAYQSIDIDDFFSNDSDIELYLDLGGRYEVSPGFWLGYSYSASSSDEISSRHFLSGRYEF